MNQAWIESVPCNVVYIERLRFGGVWDIFCISPYSAISSAKHLAGIKVIGPLIMIAKAQTVFFFDVAVHSCQL